MRDIMGSLGGLGNLGGMMGKIQEMQQKMQEAQEELAAMEVEGQSGGGMVVVTMSGKSDLKSIKIDPSLMVADEREVLEDLIVAATTDAKTKVEEATAAKMQDVTGGLPIPPGMKLF
ncbi:MAG: YbaB/EbfC family nucleoid-associated protein [Pseudomonadota bacterium]